MASLQALNAMARPTTPAITVRDRDRLRQEILEGLGWRLYRIWSTDWSADTELSDDICRDVSDRSGAA
jgi:hypothetical protein